MIYTIFALLIGLIIGGVISRWFGRTKCVGDIVVSKSGDKTIFSLELNDVPDNLELEKRVLFNIVVPNESIRE